jgi:hypothetical protein
MWYFKWGNNWYSCDREEAREMYCDGYEIKFVSEGRVGLLLPKAA